MPQCKATTKSERRCQNLAISGMSYCASYRVENDAENVILPLLGAAIGHGLFPGLGGLVMGALTGASANKLKHGLFRPKKPVFICFDFDHDQPLKHFIVGQAKLAGSPFSVTDYSLQEAAPEKTWFDKARSSIKQSELMMVMVGRYTYKAKGVLKEVEIAREEGVKVIQIYGYKNLRLPSVPGAGRIYRWDWSNLKSLLN